MSRAAVIGILLIAACEAPFRFTLPVAVVRLSPDTVTIPRGGTVRLQALLEDSAGRRVSRPVTWATSDARVASVDREGVVRGVAQGFVLISAAADGVADTAAVTVYVTVAAVTIALGDREVVVDGSLRYVAVARDSFGVALTNRTPTWSISDTAVARLTSAPPAAIVTGHAPGTAVLTAAVEGASRSVTLTVSHVRFTHIAAAESDHTCALTTGGAAYCWGSDVAGQLGNGVAPASLAPSRVEGGRAFRVASAGGRFTCALTFPGEPYCWGYGASGRLGNGSTMTSVSPAAVASTPLLRDIAAGWSHSCALSVAGDALCWGNAGALGTGDLKFSTLPLVVPGELSLRDVAVGDGFSCALAADSTAHCWGVNHDGRLGAPGVEASDAPVPVTGELAFASLAAGPWHACGLTAAGAVYCWGSNATGQLGTGSTQAGAAPLPVTGGHTFTSLSVGSGYTCALAIDGSAWCWGANASGQLGAADSGERCGDVACTTMPLPAAVRLRFTSLSAGGEHACAIATDGLAWCWGANYAGQLGDGTLSGGPAPRRVVGQLDPSATR